MRTYYCDCGGKNEVIKHVVTQCKCGKMFGIGGKISDHINMRTTLSGTTKMEFNTVSVDESIENMKRSR